jgi:hypothetical protein
MADDRYTLRHGVLPADLCAIDAVLADGRSAIVKASARVTVARRHVAGRELAFKRFCEETPLRVLEGLVTGSAAARVWHASRLMQAAGFSVPEPIAALELRRFGVTVRSCAVAQWIAGAPLDELWRRSAGAARRALTLGFADYLRALHAAGLYPQDLRAANVIVTGEPPSFVLVDLDRVRRYRRLSWRRRRKNVVQVHRSVGRGAPVRESFHFLRRYLGTPSRRELRRVAAEIAASGRVKDAEYARRRGLAAPRPRDRKTRR